MQASLDHRFVNRFDPVKGFGVLGRDDLDHIFHRMFGIAGVHALGAIGQLDLRARCQTAARSQGRAADVFGHAGVNGAFQNNEAAGHQMRCDGGTGPQHRPQIGGFGIGDWRGHGDDKGGAAFQISGIIGKTCSACADRGIRHLAIGVGSVLQRGNRRSMGIKTHNVEPCAGQRDGQRKPDIPKTQNSNTLGG